jgi:hypothetical protein
MRLVGEKGEGRFERTHHETVRYEAHDAVMTTGIGSVDATPTKDMHNIINKGSSVTFA